MRMVHVVIGVVEGAGKKSKRYSRPFAACETVDLANEEAAKVEKRTGERAEIWALPLMTKEEK